MKTESKPKASHCNAPGHEECSGWILCDHVGVELEYDDYADEGCEWWCPRCDTAAGDPVWAWCPQRTN